MSDFWVKRRGERYVGKGFALEAGSNLFTGETDFKKAFGTPTSLESDMLLIAASIFAADRGLERGRNEDISRNIVIDIPVANLAKLLPLRRALESILRHLSQDGWEIKFRQGTDDEEPVFALPPPSGRTLLFSGGLDSLAAAIEFGKSSQKLGLVSHKTKNAITDGAQQALAKLLSKTGYNIDWSCPVSVDGFPLGSQAVIHRPVRGRLIRHGARGPVDNHALLVH